MSVLSKCIVKWARMGALKTKGKFGKMCNGCAFKRGTEANDEDHNVEAAIGCLMGMGKFHCHLHGPDGKLQDAEKPCVGFQYADAHMNG